MDLTRIRRQFVIYFCRHRGKFAGKDGGASTRILRQNPHAKISVKNYMSRKIACFWFRFRSEILTNVYSQFVEQPFQPFQQ
jgi:hypothetical protein